MTACARATNVSAGLACAAAPRRRPPPACRSKLRTVGWGEQALRPEARQVRRAAARNARGVGAVDAAAEAAASDQAARAARAESGGSSSRTPKTGRAGRRPRDDGAGREGHVVPMGTVGPHGTVGPTGRRADDNARGYRHELEDPDAGGALATAVAVASRYAISVAAAYRLAATRSNVTSRRAVRARARRWRARAAVLSAGTRARHSPASRPCEHAAVDGTARPREPAQRPPRRAARQAPVSRKRSAQADGRLATRQRGPSAPAPGPGPAARPPASMRARWRACRLPRDRAAELALAQVLVDAAASSAACAQAEAISASWCSCTTRVPRRGDGAMHRVERLSASNQRRRGAGSTRSRLRLRSAVERRREQRIGVGGQLPRGALSTGGERCLPVGLRRRRRPARRVAVDRPQRAVERERGPGPRWRERQAALADVDRAAADAVGQPGVARSNSASDSKSPPAPVVNCQ